MVKLAIRNIFANYDIEVSQQSIITDIIMLDEEP